MAGTWTNDIGRKLWKNIRLDINKYGQYLAKGYAESARRQLQGWEREVAAVLSDPLNESEWHKTRPLNRKFPHLNTGKQRDSVKSGIKFNTTGAGNYSITSWGEIGVPYAEFTSQGYRKRKDGKTPNWVGWMDDIFKGTRGFNSIDDIFELLTLERAGLV